MRTLEDIVESILKKSSYPREIVEFQVARIARKFKYELSGKKKNILSKEDASDVESITTRFLQDRKGHETRKDDATQLLAIVSPKDKTDVKTTTKPLPIVKPVKKKLFRKN